MDLQNKNALVCGASEGIGRASAIALAAQGANVTVLARREPALQSVVAELPTPLGQTHGYLLADVSDIAALRQTLHTFCDSKSVHILINNTAGPPGGAAHTAAAEEYARVFQQHLLANQVLLQSVLPAMKAAQWGRIVNIISTSVKEPIANLGVSNTIRGAVASWSKTLASELAPMGITVNNVLPGYTKTQRLQQILRERAAATGKTEAEIEQQMLSTVPAGRFAEPQEIAAAIVFLCSSMASYINGISLAVDGGRTRSL
jgi:3-oxoacyl-[acyl-carrier protein] reductase